MLSSDEVKHIALLGRIGLRESEIPKYQKDLSEVFDFFRTLETLPTDTLVPISHITGRADVMREDVSASYDGQAQVLENAPATKDNFFKVRSVF